MSAPVEEAVLEAARGLVEAFGRHDTAAYFGCFAGEATFVFYTVDGPLRSRAEYAALWQRWEREDGFRVVSCGSVDQHVQVVDDRVAVVTHRVATRVATSAGEESLDERETIVFARQPDGRWLAVHEHLSPAAVAG